jgi:hypothetical protein
MKKDFSRKVVVTNQKEGLERREEILGGITEGGTYLPRPIDYSDIDKSTIDFVEKDLDITIGGEKVPVFFMTIQKWTEFTRTWGQSNEYKDIEMPFITIVRDPDIQPGNNQDGLYDVAGFPTFFYHKVPTFINGREGYDLYKIPQPTSSDLTYHVRFFTNRMQELNKMQNKIQRTFKSRQYYVDVLGHPMPILLENINDDSRIDDIEARKYYAIDFEMVVNGYILNEDDFEITPMKDRSLVVMEGDGVGALKPKVKQRINKSDNTVSFEITYKSNSSDVGTIKFNTPTTLDSVEPILTKHNIKDNVVVFKLNGNPVTLPLDVSRGDVVDVIIKRSDSGASYLTILGSYLNNNN